MFIGAAASWMHGHFFRWLCKQKIVEAFRKKKTSICARYEHIKIHKVRRFLLLSPILSSLLITLASMINDRPPRDAALPGEFQDFTGDDIPHGIRFANWDMGVTDTSDFPRESPPQSPSPFLQGYPPMNTGGSDPYSSRGETTTSTVRPSVS